jgi:nucleoside-diphosphate-sugar epimerase
LFASSGLPFQILRVPIVIGARGTGGIRRPLVIHHALRRISQGLVPFLPSHPEIRLDLISSDYVTDIIRYTLEATDSINKPVIHVCRGAQAPRITDVIDRLAAWLRARSDEWRKGVFSPPVLIAPAAFANFKRLIEEIGNQIFGSIYQTTDVLTSTLSVPKCFATSVADLVPEMAWETLCDRVFEFHLSPLLRR